MALKAKKEAERLGSWGESSAMSGRGEVDLTGVQRLSGQPYSIFLPYPTYIYKHARLLAERRRKPAL